MWLWPGVVIPSTDTTTTITTVAVTAGGTTTVPTVIVPTVIVITIAVVDGKKGGRDMSNVFYIVGVIVVVLFVAGYFGLR